MISRELRRLRPRTQSVINAFRSPHSDFTGNLRPFTELSLPDGEPPFWNAEAMRDERAMSSLNQRIPRIQALPYRRSGSARAFADQAARTSALGYDRILLCASDAPERGETPAKDAALAPLAAAARAQGLGLLLDIDLARFPADHALVSRHPDAFTLKPGETWRGPVDPHQLRRPDKDAIARLNEPQVAKLIGAWASERLAALAADGVEGFRLLTPAAAPPPFWRDLIAAARLGDPRLVFIADTPGMPREAAMGLAGCGFDYLVSSLAWWDGRASWFVEEYEALRTVAPLLAEVANPQGLALAAAVGSGLLVSAKAADPASELFAAANAMAPRLARFSGQLRQLTAPGAAITALLRADAADARVAQGGLLVLLNPDDAPAAPNEDAIRAAAGADYEPFQSLDAAQDAFAALAPGQVRLAFAGRGKPIVRRPAAGKTAARNAARQPRLVIEDLEPRVDGGPFAVKRTVGERVEVTADVFVDSHAALAVELQWRAQDQDAWRSTPMTMLENDRWAADFALERLGRWEFAVEAWIDRFAGLSADLTKKAEAGVARPVDVDEARDLIAAAAARSEGALKTALDKALARLKAASAAKRLELILAPEIAALMQQADERPFRLRTPVQIVEAERLQARFASWYELFPRSQTSDAGRHGTFDEVIARLPAIRAMGFDVLYFPPIHPIGRLNRKGRDNALKAGPDDPGSPYAIGSAKGGHDAIHGELGDFTDFQRLIAAARDQGLEIALDFAIQCSPDHPWLKQHPGWFDWRSDGSIKHAENPPKRYEDIVNVDFYKPDSIPDLWIALRDLVLFWVAQGVRTFRVDNPHTKPLAFWEWMIGEVRAAHPDVIFLAEAFTRPKMMYRLAKIGFSQSYTYFTWRHSKAEFIDYLTELTTTGARAFFRPHFFVNTPDINPYFLQSSGRGGFLIRAALAATLSGLWGMSSGFELLESDPVPGKEEYAASEKYEIKPRDWNAPGNIIAEIARLNRIRKAHPALQTHLGVRFHNAFNDNILYFAKAEPGATEQVLVAISLDPHNAQAADFEVPLWAFGLADDGAVEVEDLVREHRFVWRGKRQWMRLTPDEPYAIWRIRPEKAR